MIKIHNVTSEAIKIKDLSLPKKVMCTDRHYSHFIRDHHHTNKLITLDGYTLYVWYRNNDEDSPGLYFKVLYDSFVNFYPQIRIDSSYNITYFTVDTIRDKALITYTHSNKKDVYINKWCYIDCNKQIMYQNNWGNGKPFISSFINGNTFMLYEKDVFYKYDIHDSYYLITEIPYQGPEIVSFLYNNIIGKAIYKIDNTWNLVHIDTEAQFISEPHILSTKEFYQITRRRFEMVVRGIVRRCKPCGPEACLFL